jgi:hypothetical protein
MSLVPHGHRCTNAALAQTRVVTLKAADEVVAAILSPRGDRIAAAGGKDRVAVWSLPDGKLLQELRFPQRRSRRSLGSRPSRISMTTMVRTCVI